MYIGILSGTSLDAVDVALVDFYPKIRIKNCHTVAIPETIKNYCLEISETKDKKITVTQLNELNNKIGLLFSDAILELISTNKINKNHITAIGSHGINIQHRPDHQYPFTMQIGCPNIISEKTGIKTIANFRSRDVAAGGQGAPLAPLFHEYLINTNLDHNISKSNTYNNLAKHNIIINIGGITNISIINNKQTIGFDTGPGNCLMDLWCQINFNQNYDKNGEFSTQGKIIKPLLEVLKQDPYFNKPYPKSTGREYFHMKWLNNKLNSLYEVNEYSNYDILRTLLELTTSTIVEQIKNISSDPLNIYLCGGGAHNKSIIQSLSLLINNSNINTTSELGVEPDWVEAALFAWLAKCNLENVILNYKNITGGYSKLPLGGVYG